MLFGVSFIFSLPVFVSSGSGAGVARRGGCVWAGLHVRYRIRSPCGLPFWDLGPVDSWILQNELAGMSRIGLVRILREDRISV